MKNVDKAIFFKSGNLTLQLSRDFYSRSTDAGWVPSICLTASSAVEDKTGRVGHGSVLDVSQVARLNDIIREFLSWLSFDNSKVLKQFLKGKE